MDGQSAGDIEKMVAAYVQEKIEEEMLDVEIVDVVLSGSRCRGLEKKDSDLDVVVEYKGSIREDDFFNIPICFNIFTDIFYFLFSCA